MKILNSDIQLAAARCLPGGSADYKPAFISFDGEESLEADSCATIQIPLLYGTRRFIAVNGDTALRGISHVAGEFHAFVFRAEVIRDKMFRLHRHKQVVSRLVNKDVIWRSGGQHECQVHTEHFL
jgi:hypothetical protein